MRKKLVRVWLALAPLFIASFVVVAASPNDPTAKPSSKLSADGTLYTHPGVMSPEMDHYWRLAARRIEDCGTRHFPVRNGERLYGKGAFVVKLDRQGRLLEIDIADSTGNQWFDAEVRRIIEASAPFGPPPEIVRKDSNIRPLKVGIANRFNFERDKGAPALDLPLSERCSWPEAGPPLAPQPPAQFPPSSRPAYPVEAKRLGQQGRVVIRALIGIDGKASNLTVRESSGFPLLDDSARQAVQSWQFVPGRRNGAPEAMYYNVPFNYVLDDANPISER